MHRPTLYIESVDASTDSVDASIDSKNNFESVDASADSETRVCRCVHRLYTESVDASTDSIYRVGRCIHRLYIQSRSMHPPTLYRVGRCIHQPMKYGLSCQLSTDWLHHFGTIYYKTINFLKSCLPIESMMVDHDISFIIQWGICTQVYLMCHNLEGTLLECIYF